MVGRQALPYGVTIGSQVHCGSAAFQGVPTLHATKHPCHWSATGKKQLAATDLEYLTAERSPDLYLNLIDADQPKYFNPAALIAAIDWMDTHRGRPFLVHCSQGMSRAPSLVLLWLARRTGDLPRGSYEDAAVTFRDLYPAYAPGRGISEFLSTAWDTLR